MLLLALAALTVGQDISWQPAVPRQGSLIEVFAPDAITGTVAGEPLHFRDGKALAAVPLGTTDSIAVQTLYIGWDGVVAGKKSYVRVEERERPRERLRVAERFTPTPDSALQERIDRERGLSRDAARRAHTVPRLWYRTFLRPRDARVTSPFGGGRQVNGVWRSTHSGLDLAGRRGEPVRVANRGVVALAGDFFYGGISVYVHHGDGLMTVYHHLSRALVAVGDTVQRGQIIGRVGATGRVTGPHLHWQAQYGAIPFDPIDLLNLP
ncbi:MAG TPA: M23 family metallopeptidase [Gemmatimonadales bacterium]|jgi:murein DD-endopeptidase MepM/ murein hydrolase activator NlpD|nr:M23 family metallopeptidase [Gemmatimonadales bacterium]